MTSPSRGIAFYFQCAVVAIGVVGTVANALILYALVASKQHQKHVLIFHQNVLDFFSCLFLVITYALKLSNIYLIGPSGYWLCMLIPSENLIWCAVVASKTNFMIVTIERYLRSVYAVWSKKKLHRWVLYLAIAFVWISAVVHMFALTFSTSAVVDGVCYGYVTWNGRVSQIVYAIWHFLSFYVIVLAIFIFCYWRILVVIRRQALAMAAHRSAGPSTAQALGQLGLHQIQTNVTKTMLFVSASFAISDLPLEVYSLILSIHASANLTILEGGYYAATFLSFLYICANPFIYAVKFDPVKRVLLRLIPCKKMSVQSTESIEVNVARTASNRSGQSGK